jgi:hypothetical protein
MDLVWQLVGVEARDLRLGRLWEALVRGTSSAAEDAYSFDL